MDIFTKTYLQILSEATLTSFSELNPKEFAKSNENFPEGKDLDITDEFDKFYITDRIHKVTLLKHCIKSEDEDVHGINYMNISKERFIEVVAKCLRHVLDKRTIFKNKDITFYINDLKLKQEYLIVITFDPLTIQGEYNVTLKTTYYHKFKNEDKETIKYSDKGWWKKTLEIPLIVESKRALSFYLTVL